MKYAIISFLFLLCLESTFVFVVGCSTNYIHRQNFFCNSDYVFEAVVKSWFYKSPPENITDDQNNNKSDRTYNVDIIHTFKNGREFFRTFTGQIIVPSHCENTSQRILLNKKYLIFANKQNGTYLPVLVNYEVPLQGDVEHITHYYNCSCQVVDFQLTEEDTNGTETINLCELSSNATCLLERGYCSRDEDGICDWKTVKSCDISGGDDSDGSKSGVVVDTNNFIVYMLCFIYATFQKYVVYI